MNDTFGQVALAIIGSISLGLTGAFGFLKARIDRQDKKLEECQVKHGECEKARAEDALKLLRLEMTIQVLGEKTGHDVRDVLQGAPKPA